MSSNLVLHSPTVVCDLHQKYRRAFATATDLIVLSAYLTEWDSTLKLNPHCAHFRIIVGKDFGITRKAACRSLLEWLTPARKADAMVADRIFGFHPKALFWKDRFGKAFAIVGSSNLTAAAFGTNYEANVVVPLSRHEYAISRRWVASIERNSIPISEDWLERYSEAKFTGRPDHSPKDSTTKASTRPIVQLKLPTPAGMEEALAYRRRILREYKKNKSGLIKLFRNCAASGQAASKFYDDLSMHWGGTVGGRIQGRGWAIKGKHSNFQLLASSFIAILDANEEDRDDIVISEIDRLANAEIPTRQAFLSEMLCLAFPDCYPVLNSPIQTYLRKIKLRTAKNASEGARYLDIARKLRGALVENPEHPAKNIAELDAVIELAYKKKEGKKKK